MTNIIKKYRAAEVPKLAPCEIVTAENCLENDDLLISPKVKIDINFIGHGRYNKVNGWGEDNFGPDRVPVYLYCVHTGNNLCQKCPTKDYVYWIVDFLPVFKKYRDPLKLQIYFLWDNCRYFDQRSLIVKLTMIRSQLIAAKIGNIV